ncbi:hypothetical protein [Halorientalis halophila]|uniref:hypothetical protein n=1 Tax=Halorientalis halophila TaxID=3108499 RepID=UPI00300A6DE0
MTLRVGTACLLAVGIAALAFAGVQPGLAQSDGQANTAVAIENESVLQVTDEVDVWKRAALPLRATTPGATRVTSVNSFVNVEEFSTGDVPLNKRQLNVYDTGERIELSLDPDTTGAGTGDFAGKEAQVLVANVQDAETARAVLSLGGFGGDAADLLAGTNENVTYDLLDDSQGVDELDAEGGLETSFTPSESGVHVFAVAVVEDGDGFEVADGDATVDGEVTIVGVDSAPVQRAAADVSPADARIAPGDEATFDVDANLGEDDVTHALVLYHRPTLVGQRATLNVDEVSGDVRPEDVAIEHSLDRVNGVGEIENDLSVMGVDVSDRRVSPTVELPGLIDFVATSIGTEPPGTVSTGDATLDASAVAVEKDGSEAELTVETFVNWSNGPYQYVYVAEGEGPNETATKTGQIRINSGGGNPGAGGGGAGDDAGPRNPGNDEDDDADEPDDGGDGDGTDDGVTTTEDDADEGEGQPGEGDQGDDDEDGEPGEGSPLADPGQAAADPGTEAATDTTSSDGAGFGLAAAALALTALALLAGRRR